MTLVYLLRHARPASSWGSGDEDPGLDDTGRAQARASAQNLASLSGEQRPLRVISSPLRRCRETAQPLADLLGVELAIEAAVGEIPTPRGLDPAGRQTWLRAAFQGQWADIVGDIDYPGWRRAVAACVARHGGAAVSSHFVAINAVVSLLAGDERVAAFRPDHASITTLRIGADGLELVDRGSEAATGVL